MFKVFSLGGEVSVNANFELLFERFELMCSLAAFHDNDEEQLLTASESPSARDTRGWLGCQWDAVAKFSLTCAAPGWSSEIY